VEGGRKARRVWCSGRAGTSAAPPCRRSVSAAPCAELSPAASPCVPRTHTHTHTHTQRTHARKHVNLSFWLAHPRAMAVCQGLFVCISAHMHTMTYPCLAAYVHTHLSGALICECTGGDNWWQEEEERERRGGAAAWSQSLAAAPVLTPFQRRASA
jgi:hypothetical protein